MQSTRRISGPGGACTGGSQHRPVRGNPHACFRGHTSREPLGDGAETTSPKELLGGNGLGANLTLRTCCAQNSRNRAPVTEPATQLSAELRAAAASDPRRGVACTLGLLSLPVAPSQHFCFQRRQTHRHSQAPVCAAELHSRPTRGVGTRPRPRTPRSWAYSLLCLFLLVKVIFPQSPL